MRHRICLGAATVAAFACGWFLHVPQGGMPTIGAAEAKDYYTRKRVNGRWITGRFPKNGSRASVSRPEPREEPRASASRPEPKASTDAKPSELRFQSDPAPSRGASVKEPEPDAAPPVAAAAEPLAPPSDDRLMRLKSALLAHARTLATGSLPPPPSDGLDGPEPTAVSFDLRTGLRRTTFSDGSVVEEAFNVDAVKAQLVAGGKEPQGSEAKR